MPISFKAPENIVLKPQITVIGIGGAGSNAVNNMIMANLQGAEFVVANTDAQSLEHSICNNKIQLGPKVTEGLGAGAAPEIGAAAAEESIEDIKNCLEGSNMVFITAGMGGGTGTGAAPVIARIAKERHILTVGVVTKPFNFEGAYRTKTAEKGLIELQKYVDTLIVIPNQNLFRIATERTTFADAFKMADDVLHAGVRGVTDLMIMPGLINLDFADIRTIMSEMGKAMMGTGEASGEDRAVKAAEAAISNPLLDHNSMRGAKGVLINITGGADMTLFEVDAAANRIRHEVGENEANIIFGSTFNPDLSGIIRVSVVATGIDADLVMKARSSQEILNEVDEFVFSHKIHPEDTNSEINENETVTLIEDPEELPEILNIDEAVKPVEKIPLVAEKIQLQHEPEPKKSLFSKMWNSLTHSTSKSTLDNSSDLNSNIRATTDTIVPQLINQSKTAAQVANDKSAEADTGDIYDIPTFLRKPK